MHACGHDVHLAALFAAVRTLEDLSLPVIALLQPREESVPGGAQDMIKAGALVDFGIEAVIGVHVQPQVAPGMFSCAPGVVNASADQFAVTMRGIGGHGAYPHTTRDPIVATATLVNLLQSLVSRSIDPMHPAVVGVGSIHGGSAPNAIPDAVTIEGTVRTYDNDDRLAISRRIEQMAASVADAHGCIASVDYQYGEPPLNNDTDLALTQAHLATEWELLPAPELRSCGADDFAFYGEQVPSVMSFVGVKSETGGSAGLHSPRFLPPDTTIKNAAAMYLAGYAAALARLARAEG